MTITSTPPSRLAPSQWSDVLAGLRGSRLAIYDELLGRGTLSYQRLSDAARSGEDVEAAVAWLERNRLLWRDDAGFWRARPVATARERWERDGPAPATPGTQATAAPATDAPRPAVHRQQVSWF